MENERKVFYYAKRFLNKDGFLTDASIFTSVSIEFDKYRIWESINLQFRDCRNHVNFDLVLNDEYSNNDNTFENSIYKVDTMIQQLSMLKVKMEEAKVEYDAKSAIIQEERKRREEERIQLECDENNKENV